MAKELPYFKFEPNQWENGNIQMCSREEKGLFIDLCSMYWSRLGDLPVKLAVQKLCAGNATALNSLCDDKIIAIENGFIRIDFLEEQLSEFENTSKQNSKNAKDGWEKRRKLKGLSERNATALNSQFENNAIREDNIRVDKSIVENINNSIVAEKKEKLPLEDLKFRKLKFSNTLQPFLKTYGKDMLNEFYSYWTETVNNKSKNRFRQELEKTWDLERRLKTWERNNKKYESTNGKQFTTSTKQPYKFTIDGAMQTLSSDAERKS